MVRCWFFESNKVLSGKKKSLLCDSSYNVFHLEALVLTRESFVHLIIFQDLVSLMSALREEGFVRVCSLDLHIFCAVPPTEDHQDEWRRLWMITSKLLKIFRTEVYDKIKNEQERTATVSIAGDCLTQLHSLDVPRGEGEYQQWLARFDPTASCFPDELFDELSLFVNDDSVLQFHRVRRLRELQTPVERKPAA